MTDFRLLPIALAELQEALDWYQSKSFPTMRRFAEQVENALAAIEKTPLRFPKWDDTHRYVKLSRFPYYIAYRIVADFPLIVAIRHTSRGEVRLSDR
jgi:plasmid stabilization system protein ParE